jgi:hypothetical protein
LYGTQFFRSELHHQCILFLRMMPWPYPSRFGSGSCQKGSLETSQHSILFVRHSFHVMSGNACMQGNGDVHASEHSLFPQLLGIPPVPGAPPSPPPRTIDPSDAQPPDDLLVDMHSLGENSPSCRSGPKRMRLSQQSMLFSKPLCISVCICPDRFSRGTAV